MGDGRDRGDHPFEHGRALLAQRGGGHRGDLIGEFGGDLLRLAEFLLAVLQPGAGLVDRAGLAAVGTPHRRGDPHGVGGGYDRRPRAVAEQEGDRTVGGVDEIAHLLHPDDEHAGGHARAYEGVGLTDPVAVTRAGRGDVEGGGGAGADEVGDERGERGSLVEVGDRGDEDDVDIASRKARLGEGVLRGGDGHVEHAGAPVRPGAGLDPGALGDPLVGGVDRASDVVVRHEVLAAEGPDRGDLRPRGGGRGSEGGHSVSFVDSPVDWWSLSRARAASRSAGPLIATAETPRRVRRARPVSTPPGASSMIASTPREARVSWHRSQRTGEVIWETREESTAAPESATPPSALDRSGRRGLPGVRASAAAATSAIAGSMCSVWNAPATARGMTRVLAGGFSAKAASAARVPAATIWPPPLTFAGTRPAARIASEAACGSGPMTAAIPVSAWAAAAAIARPRTPTRAVASASVSTLAIAVAANSPTEWPATAPAQEWTGPRSLPSTHAVSSEVATMRGWATAVSLISSASAVVPRAMRSVRAASESSPRKSPAPSISNHSLSMPGVCDPCPGQSSAITTSTFPPLGANLRKRIGRTLRGWFVGSLQFCSGS